MSAAVIALYIWNFLSKDNELSRSLAVNLPVLITAGVAAFLSFVSYIWTPKKAIFPLSLVIYLLLAIMTAMLVLDTGGISSPFITLLVLVVIFSDVFGLWGLIPILTALSVFTAMQYIDNKLNTDTIAMIAFSGGLPLVASLLIWYKGESSIVEENGSNKSFHDLANELSEVANKSEVVINAIGDGVIAIDNKGIVRLINPAAQNMIGIGKQDALALNYKSILHMLNEKNEVVDISKDPIQQVLNLNQQIRDNNTTLLTKSGKKINVSLVVSPVGDAGAGVIAVFRDITNEKAEEREQAEFISTASHEMRTPVASIEGYLGLAINPQTAQIDERAHGFILKAQEAAKHLGHLFQDLLDISKADDNRLPNNPKIINIVEFTHDIIQGLAQGAAEKGIYLKYEPIPDDDDRKHIAPVYYVNLDADHIREVINNLAENAIKYTKTGGVDVNITGTEDKIIISVKDSGIGIPNEDIPHLFQKFYRVEDKNTREIGGTGLGLYLCRKLVEMMSGRIWVESKYGKGSTFFVELPRTNNQEAKNLLDQAIKFGTAEAELVQVTPPPGAILPTPTLVAAPPAQEQNTPQPTLENQATTEQSKKPNTVPRGEALTPEQIAEYAAKQHKLLSQQATQQPTTTIIPNQPPIQANQPQQTASIRPQTVSVPDRSINQG